MEGFMSQRQCAACGGRRLKPESPGGHRWRARTSTTLTCRSVAGCWAFFDGLRARADPAARSPARSAKEIQARLSFLADVGLPYLTLERRAATLSGGEAQRIRLATQIGSSLVGVLYILDEPTIGLHQRDNERLIGHAARPARPGQHPDRGRARRADTARRRLHRRPRAGRRPARRRGGAAGPSQQILEPEASLTGQFLSGRRRDRRPCGTRRKGSGKFADAAGAAEHNLKEIDVQFPLGVLTVITGVSGSGKSTLAHRHCSFPRWPTGCTAPAYPEGAYSGPWRAPGRWTRSSTSTSPRSAAPRAPTRPPTWGCSTPIRKLFAAPPGGQGAGVQAGALFLQREGRAVRALPGRRHHQASRCTSCPDVYITCDVCKGRRFNRETLEVRYKGKNIHEVLELTVAEALEFFRRVPPIAPRLKILQEVGLGYVQLGQSALTLSGGEAQRVKLSLELSPGAAPGGPSTSWTSRPPACTSPTSKQLMEVLQRLVDQGNTVVLIEHNLDVVGAGGPLIDLGPEGGNGEGSIVAEGTPEEIARCGQRRTRGGTSKRLLRGARGAAPACGPCFSPWCCGCFPPLPPPRSAGGEDGGGQAAALEPAAEQPEPTAESLRATLAADSRRPGTRAGCLVPQPRPGRGGEQGGAAARGWARTRLRACPAPPARGAANGDSPVGPRVAVLHHERDRRKVRDLSGDVVVEVRDTKAGATHTIRAERITYNQARRLVSADGSVGYSLTRAGRPRSSKGRACRWTWTPGKPPSPTAAPARARSHGEK